MSDSRETFRFRDFELDVAAYELRRRGRSVRLERSTATRVPWMSGRAKDAAARAVRANPDLAEAQSAVG
jgi:hypothetical protein